MPREYIPKGVRVGQTSRGTFAPGNTFSRGRPKGWRQSEQAYESQIKLFLSGEVDVKNPTFQRFRELTIGIVSDLGGRGALSTGQLSLARRAAYLTLQCELAEKRAMNGEPPDMGVYGTMTGYLARALKTLGLERRAPMLDLHAYLAAATTPEVRTEAEVMDEG